MSNGRLVPGLALITALASALVLLAAPAAHADRPFAVRYTLSANGSIALTGNTLLSCTTALEPRCDQSRAGTGDPMNNNNIDMRYVDTDGVASTDLSSSATLALPAGALVQFAGLYWSGVDGENQKDCQGPLPSDAPARDQAKLRFAGGGYTNVKASQVDVANVPFLGIYGSFADVTPFVRTHGGGSYTVADIRALQGFSCHAGWSLVVVFRSPAFPLRNLTVIDGLGTILAAEQNAVPFTISGFRTPPTGAVKSGLSFIGYEGDLGLTGDSGQLDGVTLSNPANPASNYFNSTIANEAGNPLGVPRNPQFKNQLGFDIDAFDVSSIIKNNQRSATVTFRTSGDGYHPAVFALATDIYEPDLKLTKAVNVVKEFPAPPGYDAVAEHGDSLAYSVQAVNTGLDATTNTSINDSIPAGTTFVPGSLTVGGVPQTDGPGDDQAEYIAGTNIVRFRVGAGAGAVVGGRLGTGETATVGFRVRVNDGLLDGTEIPNQANAVFLSETTGDDATAFSNIVETPVAVPDLTILKTRDVPAPAPGGPLTYSLAVSNVGTAPTKGTVTVTDTLPADFDTTPAISATGTGWTCGVVVRAVTCTRGDRLDKGAAFPPIQIVATLNAGFDGSLANTAIVSGGGETNTTNNSSTDLSNAGPIADVGVVKTANPDSIKVGSETTFVFTVGNSGPSIARNVTLNDNIPAGFTIIALNTNPDAACQIAGQALSCQIGNVNGAVRDLNPGQSVTVTVRARAEAALGGQTVTNTATAGSTTPDPNPANNTDPADVDVIAVSNVDIVKSVSPEHPVAGGPIEYTLTTTNSGPNTATNVRIFDGDTPAAVTLTSYSVTGGAATCAKTGNRAVCIAPSIPVGGKIVIVAKGTVAKDGGGADLSNHVTALPAQPTTDPEGEVGGVEVAGSSSADVSVKKTMPALVAVHGRATVTLRIHNAGPSVAQNVIVSDTLPPGLQPLYKAGLKDGLGQVIGSAGRCVGRGRGIACTNIGSLPVGASRTLRFTVAVTKSGSFSNTATVTANTFDPNTKNNSSTARTTTVRVRKSANRRTVHGGEHVTYRISLTNTGSRTISGARVCDLLPRGMNISSAPGARSRGTRQACWTVTLAHGKRRSLTLVARAGHVSRPTRRVNRVLLGGRTAARRTVLVLPASPRFTG